MYDTYNVPANIFNVPVFTSLFNKLADIFIFTHTDDLKEVRIVVLKVILVTGVRFF